MSSWRYRRKRKAKVVNIVKARSLLLQPLFPALIRKADTIYSQYIRLSSVHEDGYIVCYTCGGFHTYRNIDCGHYVNREFLATRYYPRNTKPQCHRCNRDNEGRKYQFAINLVKEYGPGVLEELDRLKNTSKLFLRADVLQVIETYTKLVKDLKNGQEQKTQGAAASAPREI